MACWRLLLLLCPKTQTTTFRKHLESSFSHLQMLKIESVGGKNLLRKLRAFKKPFSLTYLYLKKKAASSWCICISLLISSCSILQFIFQLHARVSTERKSKAELLQAKTKQRKQERISRNLDSVIDTHRNECNLASLNRRKSGISSNL